MAETHVVSALVERRARIKGELEAAQVEVTRLKNALASIDMCIRMFKADYQVQDIRAKITFGKNPAGLPKGAGSRKALDILRRSGEALSSTELARRILELMGKEATSETVSMLAKTIHSSFSRQRNRVVVLERDTWPGKWRLLPKEI